MLHISTDHHLLLQPALPLTYKHSNKRQPPHHHHQSPPQPEFLGRPLPARVRIVEVGPRDGLQNEAAPIPTATKVAFIDRLSASGLTAIEATSFVSPKWVPQLADGAEVMAAIKRAPGVTYSALAPNLKGVQRALEANVSEVAVFAAASEAFSQKNLNCSVKESLERFGQVADAAKVKETGCLSVCVREEEERGGSRGCQAVAVCATVTFPSLGPLSPPLTPLPFNRPRASPANTGRRRAGARLRFMRRRLPLQRRRRARGGRRGRARAGRHGLL